MSGRKACSDCDEHLSWESKGNGDCRVCHGKGWVVWNMDAFVASQVNEKASHRPCDKCYETGQCQTCGGTGYQYYSSDTDDTEQYYTPQKEKSSYGYRSYVPDDSSSSRSRSSGGGSSSGGDDSMVVYIIGLILAGGVLIGLLNGLGIINTNGSRHKQQQVVEVAQEPTEQAVTAECESNGTGNYTFINKTARTIYLGIRTAISNKNLEVGPHKTIANYTLTASTYPYEFSYDYYKSNNCPHMGVSGEIQVEQCESKILELDLPPADWYMLQPDVWTEINIPDDADHTILAPYRGFLVHFEEDQSEGGYVVNSFMTIPKGTTKIFVKNTGKREMEVSIQTDI